MEGKANLIGAVSSCLGSIPVPSCFQCCSEIDIELSAEKDLEITVRPVKPKVDPCPDPKSSPPQ